MYEKLPYAAFLQFEAIWWAKFNHQRQIMAMSPVPRLILERPDYANERLWRR